MKVFKYSYGEGIKYQDMPFKYIDKYKQFIPYFLIESWKKEGLTYYKDGFFWLINPDEFFEIISFFLPNISNVYPLIRTAFGGIIFLNNSPKPKSQKYSNDSKYNFLCPIYNRIIPLGDELDLVMDYWLTTEELIDPAMFADIYSLARQNLPIPSSDECYAFVPALALGGDINPENVKIVKMKEHLAFLSQL